MKRLVLGIIAMLTFVAVGLVGVPPVQQASATVSWPIAVNNSGGAYGLRVAGNGEDILFADCGGTYSAGRITQDEVHYDMSPAPSDLYCSQLTQTELVGNDGTAYMVRYNSSPSMNQLVAVKNGRIKWTSNLNWTDSCSNSYRYWTPESLSIGADGNVYFIALPTGGGCQAYVMGLNAYTGVQLPITRSIGGWSNSQQTHPKVWTYDDLIIVVDPSAIKKVYGYDGLEDTDQQYQYSLASGRYADVYANKDGRVFFVMSCGGGEIQFSDLGGGGGSIDRYDCGNTVKDRFVVGPNGTIVSYHPLNGSIATYDPTVDTGALSYLTTRNYSSLGYLPAYSEGIADVQVDEDNNFLVSMTYTNTTTYGYKDAFVEYIDAATNTPSVLLSLIGDGTLANRPSTNAQTGLVHDGYLYTPIWQGYTTGPSYDTYIHKTDVATAGFGTPVPQGPGFAEPTDKREYVAMGDSFSSGEGVTPFLPGTDKASPDENRCHRSEDAYAMLLEEDPDLGLNLSAFVACSGATTDSLVNGGTGTGSWSEGSQIDALSESTDVVTLTIGGNDVGFATVLETCTFHNAPPGSWTLGQDAYDEYVCLNAMEVAEEKIYGLTLLSNSETFEEKLGNVLESIEEEIGEDTQVYVLGYPNLLPEFEDIEGSCIWGLPFGAGEPAEGTSGRSTSEDEVNLLRHVTSLINTALDNAVDASENSNFHFIDAEPKFDGYELCRWSSYMNHILITNVSGSYHPNSDGQIAYKNAFVDEIGD